MQRGGVLGLGKVRGMKLTAPQRQPGFDALRPDDSAAIGQLHVGLQVPAEVDVIVVGQRQRERLGDADGLAVTVGELHLPAVVS